MYFNGEPTMADAGGHSDGARVRADAVVREIEYGLGLPPHRGDRCCGNESSAEERSSVEHAGAQNCS
jgi:hypothetical protein